jgi:predicted RND superfamily exporter protein
MRFKLKVKFHEKQSTNSIYDIGKEVNFSNLPQNVQKKFLDLLANSAKFRKYLEDGISNMGAACRDSVSHYLQLKIKKIKPIINKSGIGIFGKKTVELNIDASINMVTKKITGQMWCQKKLNESEIKQLFDENKLLKHIRWSLNELQAGDPFKTITEKKIKYSFYCK